MLNDLKFKGMKAKFIIFILIIVSSLGIRASAQVGGISASKLATICTETVQYKSIEFEPMFAVSYTNQSWDGEGKLHSLFSSPDSTMVTSEFGFRFSYGAFKNLEIGVAAPADMSGLSLGTKFRLSLGEKYCCALLAGLNLPLGNKVFSKNTHYSDVTPSVAAGLVFSLNLIEEKLCIDFDAQYQKYVKELEDRHLGDIFLNSDIGYFVTENIQLVAGINYSETRFEQSLNNCSLLTLNTGITLECAENFILVLNAPFDLIGKNNYKSKGFGMALTIIIN